MPNYKLHYFNGKGRAELARYIFAAADAKYEDVRIEFQDWPALKPKLPFSQLPVLEVDGVQVNQSVAIAHFLGREFTLAGKSNLEDAHCLALAEQMKDLLDGVVAFKFKETDETRKAEMQKAFEEGVMKTSLTALENYLKEHMSASGYIVGNDLTWADLAIYSGIELLQAYLGKDDLLSTYPTLTAHRTAIGNLPRIKKYLETRPKTDL